MQLNTSASVISFAKQLEADSAAFYEKMAERYPKGKEIFLTFSKENSNYATMIQRAYYGVITDAIEGCFAFSVETDKYAFDTEAFMADVPRTFLIVAKKRKGREDKLRTLLKET
jgi:hypothetical protein